MDRAERLLSHGYFPSQLPPAFTTEQLAAVYPALHTAWLAQVGSPPGPPQAPTSKPEIFSVARAGHLRRVLSLPNPVAQTFLSKIVATHWGEILKHLRLSSFSSSRPRFLKGGARGANLPTMQRLYSRKVIASAGYRFLLRTDISRFFPTIYTHSVPWALHTKTISKKHRKATPKYFGNLLDLALRQGQDGQTIGLPIGPDTSHIIAETIAVAIDIELKKRLKSFPAGFRYVDDYYMFFPTAQEAETALAALIRALKEFELQINFEKTITCSVLELTDDYWRHQLKRTDVARKGLRQAADINHFFELAKELAKRNSDESVMLYALKRLSSTIIRSENWTIFEAHLCHIAISFPNTLQEIARILSTYLTNGYTVNCTRLARMANAIIEEHAPLAHHSEVTWALWMCKDLNLSLTHENIDRVSEMHSSVCALILLDLEASGKLSKSPKLGYWKTFNTKDALTGDLWLLCYEASVRGWGGFTDIHVISDDYFKHLAMANVRFYNPSRKVTPLFTPKADALAAHNIKAQNIREFFALENIDDLVDYVGDEGGYGDEINLDDVTVDEVGLVEANTASKGGVGNPTMDSSS